MRSPPLKPSLFRNFDLIPFRLLSIPWCLTYHLGSTHPYSITVSMEPFSTSVFKFYTQQSKSDCSFSLEYLLLLPRSVLITISYKIALIFQHYDHIFLQLRTSIQQRIFSMIFVLNSQSQSSISASSIFRTNSFGR